MLNLTPMELILILIALAIILIWGPQKIPEFARGIGKAIYYFRKAMEGKLEDEEEKRTLKEQNSSSG